MASRCLVILGMHRSGTSAVAGTIGLLGADLGDHLLPGTAANRAGYFELAEVVALNDRLLAAAGRTWHDVRPPPEGWEREPGLGASRDALVGTLDRRFGSSSLWALKDPRLCRLLPIWRGILKQVNTRAAFAIVLRHPDEVVASLAERDRFPRWKSLLLYLDHLLDAERYTRGHPRVVVRYEQLLADWRTEIGRLSASLDLPFDAEDRDVASAVDAFIQPLLRHHVAVSPTPGGTKLDRWARACWSTLSTASNPSEASDRLDLIRAEVEGCRERLRPWFEAVTGDIGDRLASATRAVDRVESSNRALAAEIEAARAGFDAQREIEQGLRTALARRQEEAARSSDAAARLSSELEHRRTAQAELAARAEHEATRADDLAFAMGLTGAYDEANGDVLYALDTAGGLADARLSVLRGWAAARRGSPVVAMRIRTGTGTFEADTTLARPDVARAHPSLPGADRSGFAIAVRRGRDSGEVSVLEAIRADGTAVRLEAWQTGRRGGPLEAWLDSPSSRWARSVPTRFAGWCAHPDSAVVRLTLRCGQTVAECASGLHRPDVGLARPDLAGAAASGFEATLEPPPGWHTVVLRAVLASGTEVEYVHRRRLFIAAAWYMPGLRRGWRALRAAGHFLRFGAGLARHYYRRRGGLPSPASLLGLVRTARRLYREQHGVRTSGPLPPGFELAPVADRYDAWLRVNRWNDRAHEALARRLDAAPGRLPRVSVVMPVFNPPLALLDEAIRSVVDQVYDDWELCIADDRSTDPGVRPLLQQWAERDQRIRVAWRTENGHISRASNSAATLATGEWLAFLDQDDCLAPDALGEVTLYAAARESADVIYTDDDKVDERGERYAPQFKPDWSPELLLSYMYLGHLFVVRRSLFDEVGGFRAGFEGSQDYDLALRVTERARHVGHVPRMLYHWRAIPGSTAVSGAAKEGSFEAGRRAVQDALDRRGVRAEVVQPDWAARAGLGIFSQRFPDDGPSVAIIVPTRNQRRILETCLRSLEQTSYRNYRVVVIDNESGDPDTLAYLDRCPHTVLRIANETGRFNFAALNNAAARQVEARYLLFLNNDTEILNPGWLSQMVGYAGIAGVGAVGAKLLLPDGRVQHAGVVHGLDDGKAAPAFKLTPGDDHGYLSYKAVCRNYPAVTAACLLTPRALFLEMGGFDASQFGVAYNDVDYCYRLVDRGYRCVYVPDATLVHHEGHSRGYVDDPREEAAFRRKYAGWVDPYYNPSLSLANGRFEIAPRAIGTLPDRPVRALMCGFNLNWEGSSHNLYELTVRLKDAGVIDPIVYSPEDGPLRAEYRARDIDVLVEPHRLAAVFDEKSYDRAVDRFADRMIAMGAEVVHANTIHTFHAVDAAWRAGLASLWNIHESEPWPRLFEHRPVVLAARALACFRHPYRVVFVAHATAEVYRPFETEHNFAVVHHGLDLERFTRAAAGASRAEARRSLGIRDDEVAMLQVGTVCERKGQEDLPLALGRLPERWWPRVRCLIVGDRGLPYSARVRELIDRLPAPLRGRITLVPETGAVLPYYRAADLFVCTSRFESYPRVILEAMASGLPVVTTPVFGVREQVRENVNGRFYDPGDAAGLAAALDALIADPERRGRMAAEAGAVLDCLNTFDDMADRWAAIFGEAAISRGGVAGLAARPVVSFAGKIP